MNTNQFFLMDDNAINELVNRITDKLNLSLGRDPLQEDEFMTIDELAKFISMTKGSIYGLVHKNAIPYHKKGKLYFLKSEIMDWIKEGKRETNSVLLDKVDEYLLKNPFQ